jgi:ABC-type enterochelin transport system permease subunit
VETSSANNRTIAAILSAPGIAAVYISVFSLLNEGLLVLVPFYFVFAYVFSLVPGAIAILLMRKMRFTKLWQFAICGLIVSAICTAVFVVYAYSTNEPSFEFYAQESGEVLKLL